MENDTILMGAEGVTYERKISGEKEASERGGKLWTLHTHKRKREEEDNGP